MASEQTKILRAVNEIHASSLERREEICIAGKGAREATSSTHDSLDGAPKTDGYGCAWVVGAPRCVPSSGHQQIPEAGLLMRWRLSILE